MDNERNTRIEQILNSLDGNQRGAAPVFFYTRLKARVEKERESYNKTLMLRPAYALGTLILVLSINLAVILKENQISENNNSIGDNETAQSIAAEYSLSDNNTIYDLTLTDSR